MSTDLYLRLSAMMFLEYAIWGAWAPVLAARLLGPLKMSGKQTGWIYATLPIGCIISPLIAGQLADQWFATQWILAVAHLIGGILMIIAAKRQMFGSLFVVMLFYSLSYAATLPLVNSLMFRHLTDPGTQSAGIFIWAPIAWALVGYSLTGFRLLKKEEGDGSDCLIYAGILSFVMAAVCCIQPDTPPTGTGGTPILEALAMFQEPNFLIFIVISTAVAGMMQFYFLGTAQFMQDIGISSKSVPACMAIAQAAQAAATLFALGVLLGMLGFKMTLILGALSWLVMYLIYVFIQKPIPVAIAQALHGLAYVMFMIVGQIFADTVAPADIRASVQAMVFATTTGIGLFVGTQFAGIMMDKFSVDGKFVWRKVWMVPGTVVLLGIIGFAVAFHDPPKEGKPAEKPAASEIPEAAFIAPSDYVARLG
ncbi:MAG: MFS transporter [Pirellulales bacterium]|nr:MFS transporter [Pirellulales bacterium]